MKAESPSPNWRANLTTKQFEVTVDVDFENSIQFQLIFLGSTEEAKGTEGKLGVVSAVIGAGVAGKSSSETMNTSILKFRIPIQFPTSGTLDSEPVDSGNG